MKSKIKKLDSNKVIEFVYCSSDKIRWRKINVIEENSKYLGGFDLEDSNHFKLFKKKNILGGKMFVLEETEKDS